MMTIKRKTAWLVAVCLLTILVSSVIIYQQQIKQRKRLMASMRDIWVLYIDARSGEMCRVRPDGSERQVIADRAIGDVHSQRIVCVPSGHDTAELDDGVLTLQKLPPSATWDIWIVEKTASSTPHIEIVRRNACDHGSMYDLLTDKSSRMDLVLYDAQELKTRLGRVPQRLSSLESWRVGGNEEYIGIVEQPPSTEGWLLEPMKKWQDVVAAIRIGKQQVIVQTYDGNIVLLDGLSQTSIDVANGFGLAACSGWREQK